MFDQDFDQDSVALDQDFDLEDDLEMEFDEWMRKMLS